MKTLLALLFTLCSLPCLAQKHHSYTLELAVRPSATLGSYKIHLVKAPKQAKVYYFKQKELDAAAIEAALASGVVNFSYEVDSLLVPLKHPLLQLSDSLSQAEEAIRQEKERNSKRIVLDGYLVHLKVLPAQADGFEIYVQSPTSNYQALLHHFIKTSLAYYRDNAANPILPR